MKLFRAKHRPQQQASPASGLTRQEALRCIPLVNTSVVAQALPSGEILIEYPLPLSPFFLALFRRFRKNHEFPTRKLQLDEMGSQVWQQIDGSSSVERIIADFAEHYDITPGEAEKSVTAFLAQLGRRGIIALR